jgi:hypothetical protein
MTPTTVQSKKVTFDVTGSLSGKLFCELKIDKHATVAYCKQELSRLLCYKGKCSLQTKLVVLKDGGEVPLGGAQRVSVIWASELEAFRRQQQQTRQTKKTVKDMLLNK